MRNLSNIHRAMLASGCALVLACGASAHAQESKSQPKDTSGAKSSPEQPKAGEQPEHRALSHAHQTAISQAQALKNYADQHKEQLDKGAMSRYTEAIGRALDDAQQHRQTLEASVPSGSSAADQFQIVRDHEQNAAEHYRSLVQAAAKTKPDPGDLKDGADDIIGELKDAEAAHKKTFSATTTKESTPGDSSGSSSKPSGSEPNRSPESQPKPSDAPLR